MDIQNERRRLLDAEGDYEDPTGLMSEQDAYLRSVNTRTLLTGSALLLPGDCILEFKSCYCFGYTRAGNGDARKQAKSDV